MRWFLLRLANQASLGLDSTVGFPCRKPNVESTGRLKAKTASNKSLDRSAISGLFIRKTRMAGSLSPRPVNSNVRRLLLIFMAHIGGAAVKQKAKLSTSMTLTD